MEVAAINLAPPSHRAQRPNLEAYSSQAAFETNFPLPSSSENDDDCATSSVVPGILVFLSLHRNTKDETKRTQRAFTAVVDRDKQADRRSTYAKAPSFE